MPEPLTTAALTAVGYYLARRRAKKKPPPAVPPPAPLTPSRPRYLDELPLFSPVRGADRRSQEDAALLLAAEPGPLMELAGLLWPARKHLNKITYITGKPGTGKTTMARLCMQSCANLFDVIEELRWYVIDPTNDYLKFLYQVVPEDVPITRASPQDLYSKRWDIAKDVPDEATNEVYQSALFPDTSAKSSDPFWLHKGREVSGGPITVYQHLRSDWQFHDTIIPLKFPQFLRPLLLQCPNTRGFAEHELVGRLGRDICSTASATINRMATAAALWREAKDTFSLTEFLTRREVLHFSFTPDLIATLSVIASAMTALLVTIGLKRMEEFNHTVSWCDESKYLSCVQAISDLAARGRGSGMGAIVCTQAESGLKGAWGQDRVDEFTELVSTWVTFRAGYQTAESFCRTVGQIEGFETSHSTSYTSSSSSTSSYSSGGSSGPGGGSSSNWNSSWSYTSGSSTTYSESVKLNTKNAVLPSEVTGLPVANPVTDTLAGFAFSPTTGCYRFETPFKVHLDRLPPATFDQMPLRPSAAQVLKPWTVDDLKRLKLELTPELMEALKVTWGANGGVS